MAKILQQLEARLARIEKDVAELKARLPKNGGEPWYRQIVGDFADDKDYLESSASGNAFVAARSKG